MQIIVTCNPESDDLTMREVRMVAPDARLAAELAPGVLLIASACEFEQVAAAWRANPPIFTRHVNPVQHTVSPLRLDSIVDEFRLRLMGRLNPAKTFSVQARIFSETEDFKPFDINTRLADLISAQIGAQVDVRAPKQVVSVVIAGQPETAYLGVSAVEDNVSDWAGGNRRFAREEGQVSRAEFKLLEAFEVFKISLPPRGLALDLGAAPGGWTRVLRERRQYVTAVDPAILEANLLEDRNVRYKRMTAEAYLKDDPDTFDVILNDMRMDARDSARVTVAYAPHLQPDGFALMTLKLPEHGRETIIERAFEILREAYEIAGARQLFHNRSEITVYLRPKT